MKRLNLLGFVACALLLPTSAMAVTRSVVARRDDGEVYNVPDLVPAQAPSATLPKGSVYLSLHFYKESVEDADSVTEYRVVEWDVAAARVVRTYRMPSDLVEMPMLARQGQDLVVAAPLAHGSRIWVLDPSLRVKYTRSMGGMVREVVANTNRIAVRVGVSNSTVGTTLDTMDLSATTMLFDTGARTLLATRPAGPLLESAWYARPHSLALVADSLYQADYSNRTAAVDRLDATTLAPRGRYELGRFDLDGVNLPEHAIEVVAMADAVGIRRGHKWSEFAPDLKVERKHRLVADGIERSVAGAPGVFGVSQTRNGQLGFDSQRCVPTWSGTHAVVACAENLNVVVYQLTTEEAAGLIY